MLAIILLYALCASMFTISKWGLAYTEPIFFVAVRMILAGILLGGFFYIREGVSKKLLRSVSSDWFLFLQIILFHVYLTYICDLCALKNISSIESAFIYNLSPFIAAFFSYLWFDERMTKKKWAGLGLGLVAFLPQLIGYRQPILFSSSLTPQMITLFAVISSTYGWILVRALVKKGYSPIFVNCVGMFIGGIFSLITSYITEPWMPSPVTEWIPFIQATLLIVVVANILFYNLYGYLLERYTVTFLSFAGFMCPLFAALFGYMFLGESFSPSLFISFLIVSIGLFIFYHEELKQGYITRR
jgi:drug/metabolite transporter (DMT)-like permease